MLLKTEHFKNYKLQNFQQLLAIPEDVGTDCPGPDFLMSSTKGLKPMMMIFIILHWENVNAGCDDLNSGEAIVIVIGDVLQGCQGSWGHFKSQFDFCCRSRLSVDSEGNV